MSLPIRVECIRCGTAVEAGTIGAGCPVCRERGTPANLTNVYDLARAKDELQEALDGDVRGPARYAALLPVEARDLVSQDVGPTPLIAATRLAASVGVERLWIKDESRGPTWSFKDRAAAIAAAHARVLGSAAIVAASTGNAAAATTAHAQRAGLAPVILFSENVDPLMAAFVRSYGASVFLAPSKEHRWTLMRQCVEQLGWYPNSNYANPPIGNNPAAIDGYKPIAYEIWEQLGRRLPAWIYFSVCYGDGLFGVWKGLQELREMGYVESLPRLAGGEIYGSLEDALERGVDTVERAPVDHPTVAFSISGPQSTYQALHAVRDSDGMVSRVDEQELVTAQRLAVEHEGLLLETASAAALAALRRHRREGRLDADAEVVLVSSSAGVKSLGTASFANELPLVHDLDELLDAFGSAPAPVATNDARSTA